MTTSAMPVLPTEQDEWDELASIGVVLDGPVSDAQLDAAASEICRRIGGVTEDLARYTEAEHAEVERIRMRYATRREPLIKRQAELEAIGKDLALRADFGKKKSRDVGYGTYGRRQVPESVKVVDQEAALAWLAVSGQGSLAVREKTVRTVDVKEAKPIVLFALQKTGELPPGFEHTAAHDEPFVKAEV